MSTTAIDTFMNRLDPEVRATMDALRTLIAASHEALTESLKWNAPSFARHGEHRITLGLERSGAVRMVLHRGAKAKDAAGFQFDDPDQLARWPAADRGVLRASNAEEVAIKSAALGDLFRRWVDATV